MSELRAVARVSGHAILNNLLRLRKMAKARDIVAMVKADAYGHGAIWISRLLVDRGGVTALGVATLAEGVEVREAIRASQRPVRIIVFSGGTPWMGGLAGEQVGQICRRYGLTPVISSVEDWRAFHRGFPRRSWSLQLPFELKFNTGMNRLGIELEHIPEVRKDLLSLAKVGVFPTGVFSHLAVGEKASHALSRQQRARFEKIRAELAPILPDSVEFHLSNSAAVCTESEWRNRTLTSQVRPGLALYGIAPKGLSRLRLGLEPALTLEAPVIQLRELSPGDRVGYGAWYRSVRGEKVATLGIGYAEGVHRAWGKPDSGAFVMLKGRRQQFLGPISMDLASVRASQQVRLGDWARLWGEGIEPWKQAAAAGTIPYEILTSISRRVERIYD